MIEIKEEKIEHSSELCKLCNSSNFVSNNFEKSCKECGAVTHASGINPFVSFKMDLNFTKGTLIPPGEVFVKILKDGKSDLSFNDVKEKIGYLFTEFGVNFLNGYNFINSQNIWESKKDFSKEKEEGLHGWFARQGAKGKSKGWVDCNTCREGKCKSCGRQEGETRSKYPRCRPTPSQCKGYKRPDER
jgi:hypothetical protein